MKKFCLILTISIVICLLGCQKAPETKAPVFNIESSTGPNPWTNLNFYNDPQNFQFAILSDRTGGLVPGLYEKTVEKVNLLMPEFVMCVGDLIPGKTENIDKLTSEWHEIDNILNQIQTPFFYLPGNHDISNNTMQKFWNERYGKSYYHFVYKNTLFLCMNTEQNSPTNIADDQFEYIKNAIQQNPNVKWTLLFMHKPMWIYPKSKGYDNFKKIESLLASRPYTIFAGHRHRYGKNPINNTNYYILSTNKDGIQDISQCRLDHFMWVTMTDQGPKVANILVEGVLDDDPCPKQYQVLPKDQNSSY